MTPPLRGALLLAGPVLGLTIGLAGAAPRPNAEPPAPARMAPGPAQPRRGDVLPQATRAGPQIDPKAAHLRRPPPGYGWFSRNGAFVLASLSTGLVVEVVGP